MKRKLCACALAVFLLLISLPGFAQGDIRCWTSQTDAFYHIEKACKQAGKAFPISETAALEFQKKPCMACMDGKKAREREERLQCSLRGGTYVVRVPDSVLQQYFLSEISGITETMPYDAGQLENMSLMTDSAHADFQANLLLNGRAQGRYRAAEPISDDSILGSSIRQIDGIWYLVVRPKQAFSDAVPFKWRIIENEIEVDANGILSISRCGQTELENTLDIQIWNGDAPVYEFYSEQADIQIYRGLDANIAVVHEHNANERALNGELLIGDSLSGVSIKGYISAENTATYCCVITDEELGRLVSLKKFAIRYESEI